jgi:hypothetical protein
VTNRAFSLVQPQQTGPPIQKITCPSRDWTSVILMGVSWSVGVTCVLGTPICICIGSVVQREGDIARDRGPSLGELDATVECTLDVRNDSLGGVIIITMGLVVGIG